MTIKKRNRPAECPPEVDLTTLPTKRLLALLKAVRSCDYCNIGYNYHCRAKNCKGFHNCPKRHPDTNDIKAVLASREHVARHD